MLYEHIPIFFQLGRQ